MASGKYRITKIKRSWDGENHPKYAVEQVRKASKILWVPRGEKDDTQIEKAYYDMFFSAKDNQKKLTNFVYPRMDFNEKDIGSKNFIFRTNKLCNVLEYYKKTNMISQGKGKPDRKAYLNEAEKLEKRLELFTLFNEMLFQLCVDNLERGLNTGYFQPDTIDIKALLSREIRREDFEEAFINKQGEGLEIEKIFERSIRLNKRYDAKLLVNLFQGISRVEQESLIIYLTKNKNKIFRFLKLFVREHDYEKLTRGNRANWNKVDLEISSDEERQETVVSRSKNKQSISKGQVFVSNDWEIVIEKALKLYDVEELCKRVAEISFSAKIENKSDLNDLIYCVKMHYKNVVVENVNKQGVLSDAEKYALRTIHDYVKGRYRKFIDILHKNKQLKSMMKKVSRRDVYQVFGIKGKKIDSGILKEKIEKALKNKPFIKQNSDGKLKYHHELMKGIQGYDTLKISSVDIEYIKAKETLFSKIGTAISMGGYTLSIHLDSSEWKDFLANESVFINWGKLESEKVQLFNENIVQRFFAKKDDGYKSEERSMYVPKPLMNDFGDERQVQDFLNYIFNLRLNVAHYKLDFSGVESDNNDSKMEEYFDNLQNECKFIYLHSINSNNVPNCYSEEALLKFVKMLQFKRYSNELYYPSFEKVYKEMERLAENSKLTEKIQTTQKDFLSVKNTSNNRLLAKQQAYKFVLQELYYNGFFAKSLDKEAYINLYFQDVEMKKDRITENFCSDIKQFKEVLQKEATITHKIQLTNNKWIQFITSQFVDYIKEYDWIFKISDYESGKEITGNHTVRNSVLDLIHQKPLVYNRMTNAFVSVATLIDKKEVNHLVHDLRKFIQFADDLLGKNNEYKLESQYIVNDYTGEIRRSLCEVIDILEIIIRVKDRDGKKLISIIEPLEEKEKKEYLKHKENLTIITELNIENAKFTHGDHHEETNIFYDGNNFINIAGINKVYQYGTIEMLKGFFEENKEYKFTENDFTLIKNNYDKSERLNDEYNGFLSQFNREYKGETKEKKMTEANSIVKGEKTILFKMYIDATKSHTKHLNYIYAQSKYKGEQLNRAHHFVMDVYGHFLAWATRWERDMKYVSLSSVFISNAKKNKANFNEAEYTAEIMKQQDLATMYQQYRGGIFSQLEKMKMEYKTERGYYEKNRLFRNYIGHFEYFINQDKSLLEICNDFYKLFSYNTKYQRDVQTVMNNIFEKYGVIATNSDGTKAPVLKCKNEELKFAWEIDSSIKSGPKSHIYFPEFKLVHENQVEMLKKLFEYKK